MSQINLFPIEESFRVCDSVQLSQNLSPCYNLSSISKTRTVFVRRFVQYLFCCFFILISNTKIAFLNIFPGTRRCVRRLVFRVRPVTKNICYLLFSIFNVIFVRNDRLHFFRQGHNQYFSICVRSVIIEVLPFKYQASSTRINSAKKIESDFPN